MALIQPQDLQQPNHVESKSSIRHFTQHNIFDLAFRPFFILASASSIVSLILWIGYFLGVTFINNQAMNPIVWHVHEMIFGFATTVAVGFLLTAVQTWTKLASLSKGWIVVLILLWCGVRTGLYINSPAWLAFSVFSQLMWWVVVLSAFIRLLIKSENTRNYIIIPIITVIAVLNMLVISNYFVLKSPELTLHCARTAVLMFILLMGLIGGRVIPFFTASGAKVVAPKTPEFISLITMVISLLSVLFYFLTYFVELPNTFAGVFILGGIMHLWRLSFWKTKVTITIPLLWSLHLSYFLMALGMILLGVSYFSPYLSFSDALHMITIGAIGLMIFSMMSRVSLGHTGRKLLSSVWVNAIYLFIAAAALVRVGLAIFHFNLIAWVASALCWIIASVIFLILYVPILWRNEPR